MLVEQAKESLFDKLMNKTQPISKQSVLDLAFSVSQCFIYLHAQKVVHLNLKPSNILYDSKGQIKIGDFYIQVRRMKEFYCCN